MARPYILEAVNISKRFGPVAALGDVSFLLRPGSFHCLLGENGAGKSTLVKCIMGYYRPDEGTVIMDGHERAISSPRDALTLGIGMVYQHFTLIPNMTVLENLVLSRPDIPVTVDWEKERKTLDARMQSLPFRIALNRNVNDLSAGEKQKLEIIKQLLLNSKVLILDEPTSVLTPTEADDVLGRVKGLTRDTGLSVIIITHKFREVTAYGDDVTILRAGRLAGTGAVGTLSVETMAEMMVGEPVDLKPKPRNATAAGDVKLAIEALNVLDDRQAPAVRGVTLTVRGGEVVGVAGVSGNGQKALMEALGGQRPIASGVVKIHGVAYAPTRNEMRAHRVHCMPEEPLRNACVPTMSVEDNLAGRVFDTQPFSAGPMLNRGAITRRARQLIQEFRIRTPGPKARIADLSGGNVQRTVLARELVEGIEVLVITNPCFGLDFGAIADIHDRILKARNAGAAVLLISEDLDEILELSDRVVVMSEGQFVHETTPAQADLNVIGRHMAGG